ncbi:MAG: CdaR family protein [Muribaculaceae bacterium]|nr:CdaR family protein [Muribaculaceae bacterium]
MNTRFNLQNIKEVIMSYKGKNILLYLVFVVISFIFWLLLTLNNEVQKDYLVTINLTSVPDSVTIINDFTPAIRVNVKDKGSSFLKFSLGSNPSIKIDFNDYSDSNGKISVSSTELRSLLSEAFGSGVSIFNVNPDSIHLDYTTLPPKRVPVIVDAKIEPNYQYVVSGTIRPSIDSVDIYSDRNKLNEINKVYTYHFEERNLKDTLLRKVKLLSPKGVKIKPNKIDVTIPVEALITKQAVVPVITRGVPYGVNIITFPSKIGVSYLVPMSEYKENQNLMAEVYYNDLLLKPNKLKLYINQPNWIYGDITLNTDSVEYIIEQNK